VDAMLKKKSFFGSSVSQTSTTANHWTKSDDINDDIAAVPVYELIRKFPCHRRHRPKI
jgi:hypothetical protein